jgi:hypothetical protein
MGGKPIEELMARLPHLRVWQGVGRSGWYVWRLRTSPPDVRRYGGRAELLAELEERAEQQARWEREHN